MYKMSEYVIAPEKFEIISSGENAILYLSEDLAIKVPLVSPASGELSLNMEYDIQKEIFSNNYPVPQPYEISSVCVNKDEGRVCDALFMERIHGFDLERMIKDNRLQANLPSPSDLMDEAGDIFDDIRDNLDVDFVNGYGPRSRNIMYDTQKERIVLVDFGNWRMKIDGRWVKRFF